MRSLCSPRRRRVRAALIVGACSIAITGCDSCEPSQVAPDAEVSLRGRVLDATGRPVADLPVQQTKRPDAGEVIGGLAAVVATAGFACAADDAPSFCADARRTDTDARGRFRFLLTGADTQGSANNADDLDVVAGPAQADGPLTQATFRVQTARLRLPALRLWDASPSASGGTDGVTTTWSPLPRGFVPEGSGRRSTLTFDAGAGRPIWTVAHARSPERLDARVLEDAARGVSVGATTTDRADLSSVEIAYDGGRAAVTGADLIPASRGAGCRALGRAGVTGPPEPCALTDGVLDRTAGGTRRRVAIDLGTTRSIALVVARGCDGGCVLSTSQDGRRFRRLAIVDRDEAALGGGGRRARYVAVRARSGFADDLRELSVWVPGVTGRSVAPVSGPAGDRSPSATGPSADDGGSGTGDDALRTLLLVLAGLVASAAAAAVIRARSTSPAVRTSSSVASIVVGVLLVVLGGLAVAAGVIVALARSLLDADGSGLEIPTLVTGAAALVAGSVTSGTARSGRPRGPVDDAPEPDGGVDRP